MSALHNYVGCKEYVQPQALAGVGLGGGVCDRVSMCGISRVVSRVGRHCGEGLCSWSSLLFTAASYFVRHGWFWI